MREACIRNCDVQASIALVWRLPRIARLFYWTLEKTLVSMQNLEPLIRSSLNLASILYMGALVLRHTC